MVSSQSVVLWLHFGASMVSTSPPSTGEEEHHEGTAMAPSATPPGGPRPPGLIQRYREELQARHCARRTVETDEQWLRRFFRFHQLRHPREMGSEDVNAFLTHLAVEGQVSASTQNQALSALLFLDGSPRHQNHDDLHACSQQRASGSPEPRRSFVTVRTLIGGSANQTRNCSDLADGLPAERDLVEGLRTPGAFRRPERSERRYYGGPPKNC
jgi:hypothetical protein